MPLSAKRIPKADHSFDCVVFQLPCCTIPDVASALGEIHRALAPGGRLLFMEHGAAPDPGVKRWQDRLTPVWKKIAGGCHIRDIPTLLKAAGFRIDRLSQGYRAAPKVLHLQLIHRRGLSRISSVDGIDRECEPAACILGELVIDNDRFKDAPYDKR